MKNSPRLPILLSLLLFTLPALAAGPLSVTTDRADALYRKGETVTFHIRLDKAAPDAEVSWTLSKDGVAPITRGKVKLAEGRASVSGQLDEPGFLNCRIDYVTPEKKALNAIAGAAVDPRQIAPSLPPPDDFDAYWTAEKAKLAQVPMNARLTPQTSPVANVEAFDLQADAIGNPVRGYFARPAGAKPKSLPALLSVHGAGVRSSDLSVATVWAEHGFLSLDMNAHGSANGQAKDFYNALAAGTLNGYRTRGRDSRDTIYFHDMLLRLVRAMDFLTAQPEWDGRTVVVRGSSQGGYQAIAAAGLDPRVTFFAAGVPAGCDHTGFKAGRINGWPKFIPTAETNPPANVVEAVRYYDAVNFATRARAPGIITVGFIDPTCPPTSVYAARNAFPTDIAIFDDIRMGHGHSAKAIATMQDAILNHVEKQKAAKP